MEHRNRATGWQHAKLSGHKNEDMVKELLDTNEAFQKHFLNRVNRSHETITATSIGGSFNFTIATTNCMPCLNRRLTDAY